ncbi:hypothetical protein KC19_10G046000 [Ceratodon purpureus]|uniref:Uncharacterized protein n=1 Tax=Ceratodon purpureus TaxID=3225 RepID=A0A8T0GJF3_CERPU|nr:hypothetical protein KC19_10G046000 [Ceratodon purpureus]
MARVQLQRLAGRYILGQCAGPQPVRMLHSTSQELCRPTVSWLKNYPSWICAIPSQFRPVLISHSQHNQGWSTFYDSRCYSIKILEENEELSVPSNMAVERKTVAKKSLDGGAKFQVVRINDDGSWHHLSLRTSELEIHPRDIDVLARSKSFVPQRATISVRSEKVIVRMENVRALVCKDHVLLFEARRPPIGKVGGTSGNLASKKRASNEVMDRAREFFAISMVEQVKNPSGYTYEVMPFHLKMVECLLEETSSFFNQKVERCWWSVCLRSLHQMLTWEGSNDCYH